MVKMKKNICDNDVCAICGKPFVFNGDYATRIAIVEDEGSIVKDHEGKTEEEWSTDNTPIEVFHVECYNQKIRPLYAPVKIPQYMARELAAKMKDKPEFIGYLCEINEQLNG